MRRFAPALLVLLACALPAKAGDPALEALLKAADMSYELDKDGDYKLVVEWKKEQRSQLVYISHEVDELDGLRLYNVFSPAHVFDDKEIDAALARRLLADNTKYKIGAWELAGKNLYYTSKIGTGLTADQLHGVIFTTGEVADNLELELSPAKDEL